MHSNPDEKQKQHIDTARHPAMQAKESASGVCDEACGPLIHDFQPSPTHLTVIYERHNLQKPGTSVQMKVCKWGVRCPPRLFTSFMYLPC